MGHMGNRDTLMYKYVKYNKLKMNILALLIVLFIPASICYAATWYLDPSSADGGTGSQLNPFNTVSSMESASVIGDTVYIRNMGFYIDNEPVVASNNERDVTKYDWPDRIYYASKISQFGITWTFNKDYRIGQFANHDMWVLGPVTIIGISPASTEDAGVIKNGSIINPDKSNYYKQGFDNRINSDSDFNINNVAFGLNITNTLTVGVSSSLVSTISLNDPGRPMLKTAALLTVLHAPTEKGSFRPAFCGTDKTIKFNKSQLDYSKLANLIPVASVPRLVQSHGDARDDSIERKFERPWLDYLYGEYGRYIHPVENMNEYGREIANDIGIAATMLNLNYDNSDKEKLLIRFVQYGIDLYGVIASGYTGAWQCDGGHSSGRKLPILFAGMVLNDNDMRVVGNKSGDYLYSSNYGPDNPPPDFIEFGEDDQTFYVSQDDIYDIPYPIFDWHGYLYYGHGNGAKDKDYHDYTTHHLGMPEWGITHTGRRNWDGLDWAANYRQNQTGSIFAGLALPAHIMGLKSLWNHDAFFDYTDRYMAITRSDGLYPGNRCKSGFIEDMWDTYRTNYGEVWSGNYDFVGPNLPINLFSPYQKSNSIKLIWDSPLVAVDGDLPTKYRIFRDDTMIANNFSANEYIDTGLSSNTEYKYRIYSIDDVGIQSANALTGLYSTFSPSTDATPPNSIEGLQVTEVNEKNISLEWFDAVDSESGIHHYNIYRDSKLFAQSNTSYFIDNDVTIKTLFKYQISAVNIAGLESSLSSILQCTTDDQNLVLNLNCDNNILDGSQYNHETNWVSTQEYSDGVFNQCIDTSNGNYVSIPYSNLFGESTCMSFCLWARKNNKDSGGRVIQLIDSYEFRVRNNRFQSFAGDFSAPNDTEWHHYAITNDGSEAVYYLDGVLVESRSLAYTFGIGKWDLQIGNDRWGTYFDGLLDEVRVYRRALSEAEIQDIYSNNGLPEAPVSDVHDPTFEFYSGNSYALSAAPGETSVASAFHSTEPGPGLVLYSTSEMAINDFADELQAELIGRRESDQDLFDNDQFDVSLVNTILSDPKYNGVSYKLTTRDAVGTGHAVTISSLSDGTEYFYGLIASDQYGNVGALDSVTSKSATKLKFTTAVAVNVNAVPVGVNDSLDVSEDSSITYNLVANDTDADGDGLVITGVSQGSKGSVSNNGDGTVTYAPVANVNGSDSFTYTISDGNGGTNSATVTVNITPVNDSPTATGGTLTVSEDGTAVSGDLTASASDVDGDTLILSGVSAASHGTVTNNGDGTVTYEPFANYNGVDSFMYEISDGKGGTTNSTINVTVTSVNDVPVAANDFLAVNEDIAKTSGNLTGNDTDADGDTLSISSVSQGTNGTVVNNGNGTITYTSAANFSGTDSFTYTVSDGKGGTDTATVNVLVAAVNDKPVAVSDSLITDEDTAKISGNLITNDTDVEGDTLSVIAVTQGSNGTVVNNGNGTVTYTPSANYNGPDSFTYRVSDENGGTAVGTVNVMVTAVADTPAITASSNKSVVALETLSFNISASDSDNDNISFGFTGVPSGATFTDNGNGTASFNWTPDKDQSDNYTIVVTATDDSVSAKSSVKSIVISVSEAGNNLPVLAEVGDKSVTEKSQLSFTVSATDADGDALTYSCTSDATGYSFDEGSRTFTWTPDYDAAGTSPYTAEFKVDDGFHGSDSMEVTINVDNLNRDPEFGSVAAPSFKENAENSFNLTATDADGDTLTYSCDGLPNGASLNSGSGLFKWTPGFDDSGVKQLVFTVHDSNGGSATKNVSVGVENTNRDPDFTSSSTYSVTAASKLKFTVYTNDPDGDNVSITCDNKPSDAAFDASTNSFAWIPDEGTQGSYTAKFTATDGKGGSSILTVSIAVGLGNQAPAFIPVTAAAVEETETVTFTAKATDPDGDKITYSLKSSPSGATIGSSSGVVTWQTGFDDAGVQTFIVTASDGSLTADLLVSVIVNNLNRKPEVTVSGNVNPVYTDGLKLTVKTSDQDGDNVGVSISNLPDGAIYNSKSGIISWLPERNDLGEYEITIVASDGVSEETRPIVFTIEDDPDYAQNQPPVFVKIANKQVDEGGSIIFAVQATDPDNDTLTIVAEGMPSGSAFVNNTFTWLTTVNDIGNHTVKFIASDGQVSASMEVEMEVYNVNVAPVAAVSGTTKLTAGQDISLTIDASDEDGDTLTYSLKGEPKGMNIEGDKINWTSSASDGGKVYKVTLAVSDGEFSVNVPIIISVSAAALDNDPPFVVSTYPDNGSIQIPLNPLITFTLADYGEGVDYESVSILVDGVNVFSGGAMSSVAEGTEQVLYSSQDSNVVRTGNTSRYTFQYQAVDMFDYDYTPEIVISAKDILGNQMAPYSFSFTTEMFSMAKAIPVEQTKSSSKAMSQSEPAVAVSTSGIVWSTWNEGSVGSRKIKYAPYYDNVGQFDTARVIPGIGDMTEPDMAASETGELYFVWQNNISGNWDIYIGHSSDGINMDMTATVSTGEEEQTQPAVAVASNGDVYVAYVSYRKTGKDIYVAKVSSDLSSVTESSVCSNVSEQSNPVIASGYDGDIHIAWEDFRDGGISSVYAASLNGGWRNYKLAENGAEPDIAVDSRCGYLHSTWTSADDIYYCKVPLPLNGKAITAVNVIDDSSGAIQNSPSVSHFNNDSINRTIVAWTDARNAGDNNDYDIYFASVDRGSMTNILATVDTDLGCQSAPVAAANISGAPYIVFQEQGGDSQTIQMACASVVERMLSKNLISSVDGGYVGVRIEDIDSIDDVTVIVPAGALSGDVEMSIMRVSNPPSDSTGIHSLFSYDFGPSSTREFRKTLNIVIPYPAVMGDSNVSVFWYNPQTGTYSQSGMSNIKVLDINSELKALSFETTHFSQYSVSTEFVPWMVSSSEATAGQ